MRTRVWATLTAGVIAVAGSGWASIRRPEHEAPAERVATHVAKYVATPTPSLFCEFYDFMHKTVVASYDFAVDGDAASPLVLRSQVSPDGSRQTFPRGEQPAWRYSFEEDAATATAPDGETRIVLYGIKPKLGGVSWSEAGVRSNATRNLEGRCRQAFLDRTMLGTTPSRRHDQGTHP